MTYYLNIISIIYNFLYHYKSKVNLGYKFFEDIDKYIEKAKDVENANIELTLPSACTGFSKGWESKLKSKETAKNLCGKCIKLYESIDNLKYNLKSNPNYKRDCGFLNSWLNLKLYNNDINENVCVYRFYNELESHCESNCLNWSSECEMYNIKKDDLDKMRILYNLHYERSVIYDLIDSPSNKQLLLEHSTKCLDQYRIAESMCKNKNNKFCDLLKNFKNKYEELYPMVEKKGNDYSNYLKRLSGDENSKMISTAVIGSAVGLIPLVGILYKVSELNVILLILHIYL
ncbi:hypothetical protein PVBG_05602 [Plasmodium vivax Brazil I]|uniref:Uncharacterized protein n=1 Tax=Plasmodium vivax (strain Brazil I) TaxID=1033975 RepID=A0A0J9SKC2_PLAV1|nr:hypothetical protein PVBG_05602 [Plasmodium vivax Brazil I]